MTDAGLFTVTKHCTKLKEVDIEDSQFTPEILNLLGEKNIRLNRLWSPPPGSNFTNTSRRSTNSLPGQSAGDDCFDGVVLGMIESD